MLFSEDNLVALESEVEDCSGLGIVLGSCADVCPSSVALAVEPGRLLVVEVTVPVASGPTALVE